MRKRGCLPETSKVRHVPGKFLSGSASSMGGGLGPFSARGNRILPAISDTDFIQPRYAGTVHTEVPFSEFPSHLSHHRSLPLPTPDKFLSSSYHFTAIPLELFIVPSSLLGRLKWRTRPLLLRQLHNLMPTLKSQI